MALYIPRSIFHVALLLYVRQAGKFWTLPIIYKFLFNDREFHENRRIESHILLSAIN